MGIAGIRNLPFYRDRFAWLLLPPALRSLLAAAAIASDFRSDAVWCAFGSQLPFSPRHFRATGVYPGQHRVVCLAGDCFALPDPVELGLSECWSVQACPRAVLLPDFDAYARFAVGILSEKARPLLRVVWRLHRLQRDRKQPLLFMTAFQSCSPKVCANVFP